MSEHTPGPWCAVKPRMNWFIRSASGSYVLQPNYGSMNDADARLIAAAPDLLVACIGRLHSPLDDRCSCPACKPLEDAIDKALGNSVTLAEWQINERDESKHDT